MGDAARHYKRMENLPLQVNTFPRDLLQRFMAGGNSSMNWRESKLERVKEEELESESDDVELNLGLSLGGRFGVDKKSTNSLVRSSSIAGSLQIPGDDDVLPPAPAGYTGLVRTASLPVEMEDDWRKRKEMQSLRRMEAKRRRSEKQMFFNGEKDGGGGGELEVNFRGLMVERVQYVSAMNRVGSSVAPQFRLPMWAAAAAAAAVAAASRGIIGGDGRTGGGDLQGSMESEGGSSSSLSELDSKAPQGTGSCSEEKEETNVSETVAASSGEKTKEKTSTAEEDDKSPPKKSGRSSMPCVFTVGDNGRRMDGILYKYGRGEEVKIMCICHGSFHSPAEFIKHAGGTDVSNPLKHIVVNPNSSFQN